MRRLFPALTLMIFPGLFPVLSPGIERQRQEPAAQEAEAPIPTTLAAVKRICVEQLGGGQASDQMRDMIIAALQRSGLFVITENPEKADAWLRGSGDDKVFFEEHQSSDSIGIHGGDGSGSSSSTSMNSSVSSRRSASIGITDSESSHIKERRHESSASIRLVNLDGDVLWSTTQESSGGKFRGAMADVADKISRQLVEDTRAVHAAKPPAEAKGAPSMRQ